MRLSKIALLAIRGHKDLKRQIAEALDVSVATVYRWIDQNSDDLTKAAALDLIEKGTGLTQEQILETEIVSENLMGQ